MLNAARLNVFREVVAHGSFSAAADALSYSQSAVSQAIATLEGEVGAPLIERNRGGVRPTAAGAALAGHVGGILARMETAEAEIAAIAAGHGGRLRTASFPTAGRDADAAGDRRLPRLPPRRRGHPRRGRARGDRAAAAGGRVRPRPALRVRGGRRAARGGDQALRAARRPAPPGPAPRPPAGRPQAAARSRTCARSPGSRPPPPAPAPGTWSAPATRRASSPASPSRATTTRPCRAWSRPGSGSALIPQLALSTVRPDIRVRALHPRSPVRKVFAATPRAAAVTPAVATMLDVLREVSRARSRHG